MAEDKKDIREDEIENVDGGIIVRRMQYDYMCTNPECGAVYTSTSSSPHECWECKSPCIQVGEPHY